MLALATKITQSDYDHDKLKRFKYSPLVASVVQNCLIVDPLKRPDVVGVAGLVAEKILTYTDSIRYKCNNLEKKLEKEKNKTQKMFCTKQDLNHQHQQQQRINQLKSLTETNKLTVEAPLLDAGDLSNLNVNNNSSNSIGSTFFPSPKSFDAKLAANQENKQFFIRNKVERSSSISISSPATSRKNSDSNNEAKVVNKHKSSTQPVAILKANQPGTNSQPNVSPNAKLPPLRNLKTKLIIKNMQTKQKIGKTQFLSANNTDESLVSSAVENDSKVEEKVETNHKMQRSCSSSVLEKQ